MTKFPYQKVLAQAVNMKLRHFVLSVLVCMMNRKWYLWIIEAPAPRWNNASLSLMIFCAFIFPPFEKVGPYWSPYLKVLMILDATVRNAKSVNFSIVYTVSRDEVHRTGSMIWTTFQSRPSKSICVPLIRER